MYAARIFIKITVFIVIKRFILLLIKKITNLENPVNVTIYIINTKLLN